MRFGALWICGAAALGACAGRPIEPDLPAAEEAIGKAVEGAEAAGDDLGASIFLARAQRELEQAWERLAVGDERAARGLARRAQADARLAASMAAETGARDAAKRTSDHAEALGGEAARIPPPPRPPRGPR